MVSALSTAPGAVLCWRAVAVGICLQVSLVAQWPRLAKGGKAAQAGKGEFEAVTRGVALQGLAAEQLARSKGQVMVRTTELLDYLPAVLRG